MGERLQQVLQSRIESALSADRVRSLFPELVLKDIHTGDLEQRAGKIVDIVLHSGTPLKGIRAQYHLEPDEPFSTSVILISKKRRGAETIGIALGMKGFSVDQEVQPDESGDLYYRFTRVEHTKPTTGFPVWENQKDLT